jgi:hypothetical protein
MPNIRVIEGDELDDFLASTRARGEGEQEVKRKARERVQAREAAQREDATLAQKLEAARTTRDNAVALLEKYDAAIDEAVDQLGRDHPVAKLLLAVRHSSP